MKSLAEKTYINTTGTLTAKWHNYGVFTTGFSPLLSPKANPVFTVDCKAVIHCFICDRQKPKTNAGTGFYNNGASCKKFLFCEGKWQLKSINKGLCVRAIGYLEDLKHLMERWMSQESMLRAITFIPQQTVVSWNDNKKHLNITDTNTTQEWLTHHISHLIWNQYGPGWHDQSPSAGHKIKYLPHWALFEKFNSIFFLSKGADKTKNRGTTGWVTFSVRLVWQSKTQTDSHNYLSHATCNPCPLRDGLPPCNYSFLNYLLQNWPSVFPIWNIIYRFWLLLWLLAAIHQLIYNGGTQCCFTSTTAQKPQYANHGIIQQNMIDYSA